jgi:hypothetical protein
LLRRSVRNSIRHAKYGRKPAISGRMGHISWLIELYLLLIDRRPIHPHLKCVRVIFNSALTPHRPQCSILTPSHPCPSTLDTTRPPCCINLHTLTHSPYLFRLLKGPITPGPSSHVCLASCGRHVTHICIAFTRGADTATSTRFDSAAIL